MEGTVTDAANKKPIQNAVVSVAGVKPSATNEVGQYQTIELTGSKVKLVVTRDGYKAVEREVTLEPGKPTVVDLTLETEVQKAKFLVTAAAAKKPVKATIGFAGTAEAKLDTAEGVTTPTEIELPAGQYVLTANAEGFLAQTREVQVTPGAALPVAYSNSSQRRRSPWSSSRATESTFCQQVHF